MLFVFPDPLLATMSIVLRMSCREFPESNLVTMAMNTRIFKSKSQMFNVPFTFCGYLVWGSVCLSYFQTRNALPCIVNRFVAWTSQKRGWLHAQLFTCSLVHVVGSSKNQCSNVWGIEVIANGAM